MNEESVVEMDSDDVKIDDNFAELHHKLDMLFNKMADLDSRMESLERTAIAGINESRKLANRKVDDDVKEDKYEFPYQKGRYDQRVFTKEDFYRLERKLGYPAPIQMNRLSDEARDKLYPPLPKARPIQEFDEVDMRWQHMLQQDLKLSISLGEEPRFAENYKPWEEKMIANQLRVGQFVEKYIDDDDGEDAGKIYKVTQVGLTHVYVEKGDYEVRVKRSDLREPSEAAKRRFIREQKANNKA